MSCILSMAQIQNMSASICALFWDTALLLFLFCKIVQNHLQVINLLLLFYKQINI